MSLSEVGTSDGSSGVELRTDRMSVHSLAIIQMLSTDRGCLRKTALAHMLFPETCVSRTLAELPFQITLRTEDGSRRAEVPRIVILFLGLEGKKIQFRIGLLFPCP